MARTVQPQGLTEVTPSINMTPLIDVVLVLLLVFMAVTPSARQELEVSLAGSRNASTPAEVPAEQLVLRLDGSGGMQLDDQPVLLEDLTAALTSAFSGRDAVQRVLFVVAADSVGYAALVDTIERARRAHPTQLAFATDAGP